MEARKPGSLSPSILFLVGSPAVLYLLHSPCSHCPAPVMAATLLEAASPFGVLRAVPGLGFWKHCVFSFLSILGVSVVMSWLPYLWGLQSLCIKLLVLNDWVWIFLSILNPSWSKSSVIKLLFFPSSLSFPSFFFPPFFFCHFDCICFKLTACVFFFFFLLGYLINL